MKLTRQWHSERFTAAQYRTISRSHPACQGCTSNAGYLMQQSRSSSATDAFAWLDMPGSRLPQLGCCTSTAWEGGQGWRRGGRRCSWLERRVEPVGTLATGAWNEADSKMPFTTSSLLVLTLTATPQALAQRQQPVLAAQLGRFGRHLQSAGCMRVGSRRGAKAKQCEESR